MEIASFTPNEVTTNSSAVGEALHVVAETTETNAFAGIRSLDVDTWDVNLVLLAETSEGMIQLIAIMSQYILCWLSEISRN